MRILDLVIQDFGVYRGRVAFDLQPRQGNIIIFGGKNGSGKTTLLEAIQLCLYGRKAIGERVTQKAYDSYIVKRMHQQRKSKLPTHYTSVSLKFEYAQFSNLHLYEVTRAWEKLTNTIKEQLVVFKDGEMMTGMAEERWQDFIEDIVPPGIANLFFFDGEKIQSLASDKLSEQSLGKEIKQLLGLNLVERLQADLDIYKYQQRKGSALPDLTKELEKLEHNRNGLEERYQTQRQDRSQTQTNIVHIQGKIEDLERRISQESSGFAFARKEIEQRLTHLDTEIEQTKREIQNLVSSLLPFTFVPELVNQLKNQLIEEEKYQQWEASRNLLSPKLEEINQEIVAQDFWEHINGEVRQDTRVEIVERLDQLLSGLLNLPEKYQEFILQHQVADPERLQLLSWIDQSLNDIPTKANCLGQQLEHITHQRKEAAVQLRKIPENDILKPLVSELNTLHERLGQLTERKNRQLEEEKKLRNVLDDSNRKLKKAYDSFRGGEALEKRLLLVHNVQDVLDDFLDKLTAEKTSELERLLAARYRELSRKPDMVYKVAINPEDFKITLFGENKRTVLKEHLSAGEKQMLAISILWALRQLSKRPFPIMIDTPLGRLDSEHRNNLVEQYFPFVSHQVVLFSTDTEVDQVYFDALKPHISHAYHLEYDANTGASNFSEGYFWNEVIENAAEPN